MATGQRQIDIKASPEAIFDLIHDYGRRLDWDPFLKKACLLGGAQQAEVGAVALCVAKNRLGGMGMESVYVSFDPPEGAAVKMTRGPWILHSFAASLRHEKLPNGETRTVYKFNFKARPRWARPLLEPVMARVFGFETKRRLKHLKSYLENPNERTVQQGDA